MIQEIFGELTTEQLNAVKEVYPDFYNNPDPDSPQTELVRDLISDVERLGTNIISLYKEV